jgi:hypothetical protein
MGPGPKQYKAMSNEVLQYLYFVHILHKQIWKENYILKYLHNEFIYNFSILNHQYHGVRIVYTS